MWEYRATLVKIVDGDTIDVELDLGFGVKKQERLRLARVDAPEVRGPERPDGLASTEFVKTAFSNALAHGAYIMVETRKGKGKYGRYIADVWLPAANDGWLNLSELLIKNGYARPYRPKGE